MLIEITTTHVPATDLGYLLHKHPDRLQTVDIAAGQAHIFFPEATAERCTACLMLDINPVDLVRVRKGNYALQDQYINDRPYTSNSFMSSAITKAFGTALNGRCNAHPELPVLPLPFTLRITSLRVDADLEAVNRLFKPLDYELQIETIPLDKAFPDWGLSKYINLTLRKVCRLQELLSHVYVLIPVLDNSRHSWVTQFDIEILLQKGKGWLESHPERDWITQRFMRNIKIIANEAILRLTGEEALPADEPASPLHEKDHQAQLQKTFQRLKESGAQRVLDIGCGSGKLLRLLLKDGQFKKITGMDVSFAALQKAKENLHLDEASPALRERLSLFQGSVTYLDERLKGYNAIAMVEVIEHLNEDRLPAMEKVVFGYAAPQTVVLTIPNAAYKRVHPQQHAGEQFQSDQKLEWTREAFENWSGHIRDSFGYSVTIEPVGHEEPDSDTPSLLAVFQKLMSFQPTEEIRSMH